MAGFNPYAGGAWTPNGPTWAQPQYPVPQASPYTPTYSGTGSHLFSRQPRNNMPRVSGPESAKAFPMNPGDEIVVFDANDPVFYFLSADDSGFKQMKTFEFTEKAPDVLEVKPQLEELESAGFATKDDVDSLKETVSTLCTDLAEVRKMLEGLVS